MALVDRNVCLYWRGRALEGLGKRDEARDAYQKLLDRWKEAEASLPLKIEVEAALARLGQTAPNVKNEPH